MNEVTYVSKIIVNGSDGSYYLRYNIDSEDVQDITLEQFTKYVEFLSNYLEQEKKGGKQ